VLKLKILVMDRFRKGGDIKLFYKDGRGIFYAGKKFFIYYKKLL